MSADTDAVLTIDPTTGLYDISFDSDGDILTRDFFDTSLLMSLFCERRADSSEVVIPELRRGWIGSVHAEFENGSKIWLLEQARLTKSNLNTLENEAAKALEWLVSDGFAVSIGPIVASATNGKVILDITINRSKSRTERRHFVLWQNTGS